MSDNVTVEPADKHRQGFARWSLAQQPGGYPMASGTEWLLTRGAFADVPLDLLDGAKVDGHIFRPVLDGYDPQGDGYAPVQRPADVVPVQDGPKPEAVAETVAQAASRPRKRTAPKRNAGASQNSTSTKDA